MKIIFAILIFSIIILFHELGHFLFAKRAGIRVNEFCIGLGPTLVGFTKGETKYSIKLLPFGGACMMEGEDGDSPVISGVMDGYPAQEAGMKEGDVIKKLNSKKIHLYREVSIYTFFHGDQSIDVVYERDRKTHETTITPRYDKENDRYLFGFYGSGERTKGGPVKTLQYGWFSVFVGMLNWTILLSANLGVMNLLPLPALDGGRLVFLIIEAIRGKGVDPEKVGMVHFIGICLLMALMVVIMFNDIRKLF